MQIELRHVTKRFGRATALRDITLTIPLGRRVGLIGPNGSGKSTLTRVVMGILSCAGEVLVDGRSPFSDRTEVARRLAYVPQIAPQLAAPVGGSLRAVAKVRGLPMARLVQQAGRLDLDVGQGKGGIGDRPFRDLSGGMKQKLLLSLALSAGASLLILDEPTASLDARSRERLFQLLFEEAAGATLLLCSHRLEEIRHLVDHVVALSDGRVTYDGPALPFLGQRAMSLLEVFTHDGEHAAWLHERGFRSGTGGAWVRTVTLAQKMPLVSEITRALGPGVRNLVIRDLETIELGGDLV